MSIFAVMHLFAFPWKEYKISADPLTMNGAGYSGSEAKYKGGPFGLKALADVFNPWDLIKASARGFRWLFVGYKHRTDDVSYQPQNKMDGSNVKNNSYNGDVGTELRPSDDGRRGRGTTELGEDDRAGLLRHSAIPARATSNSVSPYRADTNDEFAAGDDSALDLGAAAHHSRPVDSSYANALNPTGDSRSKGLDYGPGSPHTTNLDTQDTGYHPGIGRSGVHPALRSEDGRGEEWDHWAGAQRPNDADSMRPPTYRTEDGRR